MVSIVGKSGSGKTTLIEKLVPELKRRGYRIGTVKHHRHDFEIDQPGKDSWRHAQAGADSVMVASPQKLAFVKKMDADMPLAEMRDRFFTDVDLLIVEGYKTQAQAKIEIFRPAGDDQPLYAKDDQLLAFVSDCELQCNVPRFGLEEINPLVDFLEQTFGLTIDN